MDKPKAQQISTLHTYWNLALLARGFDLETTLPPEVCAERLAGLHQSYRLTREDLDPRKTSRVTPVDGGHAFDLRLRRHVSFLDVTTVKATGHILHSEGLQKTLVRGTFKLGWLFLTLMFSPLLLLLWVPVTTIVPEDLTASFVIAGFAWAVLLTIGTLSFIWVARRDYRRLTRLLATRLSAVDVQEASDDLFEDEAEALQAEQPNATKTRISNN